MNNKISQLRLVIIFLFLLLITGSIHLYFPASKNSVDQGEAVSEKLAADWFMTIEKVKNEKDISYLEWKNIKYGALLGIDYSHITTTLGSLEAKQTSLNPKFAGLIYRWLREEHIDSSKTVGLIISGSFPCLAISTLAALQTIGARAVLISSLGSSTYGANDPLATWIDYESWLRDRSRTIFSSSIITLGGENDAGEGMSEEGIKELEIAVERNSRKLYFPSSLEESIDTKTKFLLENNISLLLNIGGNQAAIGACIHSPILPNGKWNKYSVCNHSIKGILSRVYERGIPVIHLLNIRDLAIKNGLIIGRME